MAQRMLIDTTPTAEQRRELERVWLAHGCADTETVGTMTAFVRFGDVTYARWHFTAPLRGMTPVPVRLVPLGDGRFLGRE